jgi:hypothetical protein
MTLLIQKPTGAKLNLAKTFAVQDYMWEFPAQYGLWSPANITTALWLDAADASTVTTDGSAVSQWNDKSGNHRNAVQATAGSRPGYSGGHVTFNGSTFLQCTPGWGNYWEWFLVAKFDRTDILQVPIRDNGLPDSTAIVGRPTSGGDFYRVRGILNNDYLPTISSEFDTARFIHGFSSRTSNNAFAFVNGTQKTTWSVSGSMGTTLFLGVNGNLGGNGLNGSISEFVLLPTDADVSGRQKLEGYLAHKWGLTANLPGDHPYKTVGPTP